MQLVAKNGRISLGFRGDGNKESIAFQVTPLGRKKLTIADKFLFGKDFLEKDKETASGRFVIQKITPVYTAHYKLGAEKIGHVDFFEAFSDDYAEYSYPPLVYFTVYVSDSQFEYIKQGLLNRLPIAYLQCSTSGFDYGWEPDSSNTIWKLKEGETEISHRSLNEIAIQDFDIGFGNQFDDEYHEGLDDDTPETEIETPKKESTIIAWVKENIFWSAVIVMLAVYLLSK